MSFADMHSEFLLMKQIEQMLFQCSDTICFALTEPGVMFSITVTLMFDKKEKKSMYFVASSLNVFYTTKTMIKTEESR